MNLRHKEYKHGKICGFCLSSIDSNGKCKTHEWQQDIRKIPISQMSEAKEYDIIQPNSLIMCEACGKELIIETHNKFIDKKSGTKYTKQMIYDYEEILGGMYFTASIKTSGTSGFEPVYLYDGYKTVEVRGKSWD